jgi:hypothetical protein
MTETYRPSDHTLTHPMADPASPSGFTVRTEVLKKFTVQMTVTREHLESGRVDQLAIEYELNKQLQRELNKVGRVQHKAAEFSQSESFLDNTIAFRLVVMTRESQEGQWPSVHQAMREDEEDLREALRHPADYVED